MAIATVLSTILWVSFLLIREPAQRGWNCSTSPILIPFVPLLVGWVIYAAIGRKRGDL
jgi:hypothetical protein